MKRIFVECGPYYWVVSSGRHVVTIEKEEGETQRGRERRRERERDEGVGEGHRIALLQ